MENEIAIFNEFLEWFSGTRLWARGEIIIKYVIPFCLLWLVFRGIKLLVSRFLQGRDLRRIISKHSYEDDLQGNLENKDEFDELINRKEKFSNRPK